MINGSENNKPAHAIIAIFVIYLIYSNISKMHFFTIPEFNLLNSPETYSKISGFICIAAAILVFFSTRKTLSAYLNLGKWIKTNGEVISSRIIKDEEYYRPEIKYKYSLNRKTYYSDSFFPEGTVSTNLKFKAQEAVEKYVPGDRINVYFNPDDFSQACLEKKYTPLFLFSFVIITFISVGILAIAGIINL